jgi:hypothetical protein
MADILDLGSLLPGEYAAPDVQAALGGGLDSICNNGGIPVWKSKCNNGTVPLF